MKLRLVREQFRPDSTIGRMLVDDVFECFTLEDGVRTKKIHGATAIPAGAYRVTVEDSPRFKRKLPRLHGVPNFSGVLIHPGNTAADTEGCILVGRNWKPGQEAIGASRLAFDTLFSKINSAIDRGEEVSIAVMQEGAPSELMQRAVRPPEGKPVGAGPTAKKRTAKKRITKAPDKRMAKSNVKAGRKTGAKRALPRKAAARKKR